MSFKVIITSPVQVLRLLQVDAPELLERYDRIKLLQIVSHLQDDNVETYTAIVQALQGGHVEEREHAPNVPTRYAYRINATEWFIVPY